MSTRKPLFTLLLLLAGLLQSCQPPSPPRSPTEMTPPTVSQPHSSPAVLAACPILDQQKAMRQAYIPNWEALGLFACYEISLDLSAEAPYPGSETLVFTNSTTETLKDVVLRTYPNAPDIYGGAMNVTHVRVNNQPVQTESLLSDQSALRIILSEGLLSGQTVIIKLDFSLTVPRGFNSNFTYGVFGQSTAGSIFVLANWFPILAVRKPGVWQSALVLPGGDAVTSESALYRVAITAPKGWSVVASGVEISTSEKNGSVRHEWVSGPVRDFMLTASPDFEMRQTVSDDIQIRQWGVAKTTQSWEQALETARTALEYYQKSFGPYPFKELEIVAVPLQYASGVEYPGVILITENAYLPTSRAGLLQVVVAHEIAHQWWYSVIGNDVQQDPWQDEGLTTYSTYAYLRAIGSPIFSYLQKDYQDQVSAYERDHSDNTSIAQPLTAFKGRESAYSTLVYLKAALFFDQIRQRMGNARFEKALQQYYLDHRFQLVPPGNLLSAFNNHCECNLSDLYHQFGVDSLSP